MTSITEAKKVATSVRNKIRGRTRGASVYAAIMSPR